MPKRKSDEKLDKKKKSRRRRVIWSDSDSEENSSIGTPSTVNDSPLEGTPAIDHEMLAAEMTPPADLLSEPVRDAAQVAAPEALLEEGLAQVILNPDILAALGAQTDDEPLYGDKIHDNLSQLWSPLLKKGLSKEDRDRLLKDHAIPRNCILLQAPKLNLEISAAITESAQNRDKKLMSAQQQLGTGITAINRALDILLSNEDNKLKIIKYLSDACRILCDLHYTESQVRIKLVTPSLDKSFLNVVQETHRDETLFGNKLSEKIKSSKTIEKQGLQIKKSKVSSNPAPSTSTTRPTQPRGNWTAPPRYTAAYTAAKGARGGNKRPTPRKAPAPAPVAAKQPSKRHTRARSRQ